MISELKADPKVREHCHKEIIEYYDKKYPQLLNLDKLEDVELGNYLQKAPLEHWSHRNRITSNVQMMKHMFLFHRTDRILATFKVTYKGTSCIFGYLHSACHQDKKPTYTHDYVCTGPTFRSQDGEYRSRLIRFAQFKQLFDKYNDDLEVIEAMILHRMEMKKLTFQVDFHYPEGCRIDRRAYEDSINCLRLPVRFFQLCWAYDFRHIHEGTFENHINPAYQRVIYQEKDADLLKYIVELMGDVREYEKIQFRIAHHFLDISSDKQKLQALQCGQKLFPISSLEAIRVGDIGYNAWREIYITDKTSNLVLNLISPSFSFINNWFYVQNAHAGMFDNKPMHDKYNHSKLAGTITDDLRGVDKKNYVDQDDTRGPINSKFSRLSRNIRKTILQTEREIKVSDLAICITSEYIGRTMRDIPALVISGDFERGLDKVFTDTHLFHKHMFEFVYAFYCMNSKVGVFHGDLHLNNATIMRLYTMLESETKVNNPHVAYITGAEVYAFPHLGLFSAIIDFSRAVCGNYHALEREFSAKFAEIYFKEQRERVMEIVRRYFPKLSERYGNQIESLLITKFALMFKILSVVDTYTIMNNIAAMFSIDAAFKPAGKDSSHIKVAEGAAMLLAKLIDESEKSVYNNVNRAVAGEITEPEDIEWPNLEIIRKVFSSYLLTPTRRADKSLTVVEIFNHNNDMTYEIENFDTWGPLLSADSYMEIYKKHGMPMDDFEDWLHYRQYDETAAIDALKSKYEKGAQDVLAYESWMFL